MKTTPIFCACVGFFLICNVATAAVLLRSRSRSHQIHLNPSPSSISFQQPRESFNRPIGTVALQPETNTGTFSNSYGRTFGQYGSYRDHKSWQHAVRKDNLRHSLVRGNLKDTFPWLFNNMKTPSLRGFGLDGFWNSYTPYVPEGTAAAAMAGTPVNICVFYSCFRKCTQEHNRPKRRQNKIPRWCGSC